MLGKSVRGKLGFSPRILDYSRLCFSYRKWLMRQIEMVMGRSMNRNFCESWRKPACISCDLKCICLNCFYHCLVYYFVRVTFLACSIIHLIISINIFFGSIDVLLPFWYHNIIPQNSVPQNVIDSSILSFPALGRSQTAPLSFYSLHVVFHLLVPSTFDWTSSSLFHGPFSFYEANHTHFAVIFTMNLREYHFSSWMPTSLSRLCAEDLLASRPMAGSYSLQWWGKLVLWH